MRRFLTALGLVAALLALAPPASARGGLVRLWDATSSAGGSIDSGVLNTRNCTTVFVLATAGGAAAPASYTVSACRTTAVASCVGFGMTLTAPAIGATSDSGSMGPGSQNARVVPPFLRYQCTGGAASTCQVTVWCSIQEGE